MNCINPHCHHQLLFPFPFHPPKHCQPCYFFHSPAEINARDLSSLPLPLFSPSLIHSLPPPWSSPPKVPTSHPPPLPASPFRVPQHSSAVSCKSSPTP